MIDSKSRHIFQRKRSPIRTLLLCALLAIGGVAWGGPDGGQAYAACASPSTNYGSDSIKVTVPATTTYVVWTRMNTQSSTANTLLLEVDGGSCFTVGGNSIPPNSWEWINYIGGNTNSPLHISLTQGTHTLKYIGNAGGVGLDEVILLQSNNSCVPSGTGSNCAPASPAGGGNGSGSSSGGNTSTGTGSRGSSGTVGASTGTSQAPGTTVSTSTTTVATALSGVKAIGDKGALVVNGNTLRASGPITLSADNTKGAVKVAYYLNSKLLGVETSSPFQYRLDVVHILNGTYTITVKEYYASGQVKSSSQTLIISNPASFTQVRLAAEKYATTPPVIIILLVALCGALLFIKRQLARRAITESTTDITPATSMAAPEDPYHTPLGFTPVPPLVPPQADQQPSLPKDEQDRFRPRT